MHPALAMMLTQQLPHEVYIGQDITGAPTYAAPALIPARVEYVVQRFVDLAGQERISRARVYCDGDVALGTRDRVTLPDGTAPAIRQLAAIEDETGARHHWEVWF